MMARLTHLVRFYIKAYKRLEIRNKAASLSYYTIVSIFPMILILAALSGYFLEKAEAINLLKTFFNSTLPYHSEVLLRNAQALFVKKKTISWFGIAALIISAQILFVNFEKIVNGLLHTDKERNFLIRRLLFIFWLLALVFLLFSPVVYEMFSGWVGQFGFNFTKYLWWLSRSGFLFLGFFLFMVVMLILPTKRVHPKRLFVGGIGFSVIMQLGKVLFKWYVYKNFDRYNLIYGSLSSVVLVVLWIFYFYNFFLFFVYWVGRDRDPVYTEVKQGVKDSNGSKNQNT